MNIFVSVKKIGAKRNSIEPEAFSLPDDFLNKDTCRTVGDFLDAVTEECLPQYNNRQKESTLLHLISSQEIDAMASAGKVSFGAILPAQDRKIQSLKQAVQNTRQCYEDGFFALFVDGKEIGGLDGSASLDSPIHLKENSTVAFIRLTMLAGRMW